MIDNLRKLLIEKISFRQGKNDRKMIRHASEVETRLMGYFNLYKKFH